MAAADKNKKTNASSKSQLNLRLKEMFKNLGIARTESIDVTKILFILVHKETIPRPGRVLQSTAITRSSLGCTSLPNFISFFNSVELRTYVKWCEMPCSEAPHELKAIKYYLWRGCYDPDVLYCGDLSKLENRP